MNQHDQLEHYLDGQLGASDRASIEDALRTDPSLRAELQLVMAQRAAIGRDGEATFRRQQSQGLTDWKRRRLVRRILLAGLGLVVLLAGLVLLRSNGKTPTGQGDPKTRVTKTSLGEKQPVEGKYWDADSLALPDKAGDKGPGESQDTKQIVLIHKSLQADPVEVSVVPKYTWTDAGLELYGVISGRFDRYEVVQYKNQTYLLTGGEVRDVSKPSGALTPLPYPERLPFSVASGRGKAITLSHQVSRLGEGFEKFSLEVVEPAPTPEKMVRIGNILRVSTQTWEKMEGMMRLYYIEGHMYGHDGAGRWYHMPMADGPWSLKALAQTPPFFAKLQTKERTLTLKILTDLDVLEWESSR